MLLELEAVKFKLILFTELHYPNNPIGLKNLLFKKIMI